MKETIDETCFQADKDGGMEMWLHEWVHQDAATNRQ